MVATLVCTLFESFVNLYFMVFIFSRPLELKNLTKYNTTEY